MFKSKFRVKEGQKVGIFSCGAKLCTKFRFPGEISPKEKDIIEARIQNLRNITSDSNYFISNGFEYDHDSTAFEKEVKGSSPNVGAYTYTPLLLSFRKTPGFDLVLYSDKEFAPKDVLDLQGLHDFIETGEGLNKD